MLLPAQIIAFLILGMDRRHPVFPLKTNGIALRTDNRQHPGCNIETAGAQIQLRVVSEAELQSVLERRSLIGALSEFVPESLRSAFNIALAGGLFAGLFLIGTMMTGGTRKRVNVSADDR